MFGMNMLNVMIGLVTVYLVFGMACTSVVEALMTWLNVRSSNLEDAMKEFLHGELKDNTSFVEAFYAHPLVQTLSKNPDGRPSYIPPDVVGQVVIDLLTQNGKMSIADAIAFLPDTGKTNRIKGVLETLCVQTQGEAQAFRKSIENHFNATMDRASGWVKRRSHSFSFIISIVLVCGANVDTVSIANSLAANPDVQVKMLEIAGQQLEPAKTGAETGNNGSVNAAIEQSQKTVASLQQTASKLESTGLQLGWNSVPVDWKAWISKIAGLLVSIFAVSLGAPFWFSILQRFMQMRTSGTTTREPITSVSKTMATFSGINSVTNEPNAVMNETNAVMSETNAVTIEN